MNLTFPEIDESRVNTAPTEPARSPVARAVAVVSSLKDAALARFSATEADLRALAEKYRAVAFDVTTPAGMKVAKAARLDLRENGRYAVQRIEAAVRDEANELKRVIGDKAAELVAIVRPIEDAVHGQIEARETWEKEEKARLAEIERQRVAGIKARIATIRGYVTQCDGRTSAQIESARCRLLAVMIDDSYAEFREEAETALRETLDAMLVMQNKAKAAEDAAAAAEAQRIEQARIAEEQRAEAARLQAIAEAQAEQKRRDDEAAAARLAELERREREIAAREEAARKPVEPPASEPAADANPGPAGDLPAVAEAQAAETAIEPPAAPESSVRETVAAIGAATPAVVEGPTLKLGDINARLAPAVSTSADGLVSLGFAAVPGKGVAKLYRESDWPAIKAAIVAHINSLT